ncbi:bifunctional (p)ppGpp synthetase/guanosine-3',5'-bis(diphosphate) 3'-pyrophosphohydrolase [Candidatus Peribacteria bacterium]|nr:bifunctional (p)ppGpp synthetase/guanosine-3',5'-bis(diphosphate) 3'-pyrophosphohydrolase [Candidatus Peribacteria bacterium]
MPPLSVATAIAVRAHSGQKRADGRDYIEHPMAVARILMGSSTHLPTAVYSAAMLHDVMEDAHLSYAELAARVGREAATMVLGLTRPQRVAGESSEVWEERYIAQMRIVFPFAPGLLLIKLADRIHNLQTAHTLARPRRARLIDTTQRHYAPFFRSMQRMLPIELQCACTVLLRGLEGALEHAHKGARCFQERMAKG